MKLMYGIVELKLPVAISVDEGVPDERVCQLMTEKLFKTLDGYDKEEIEIFKIDLMNTIPPKSEADIAVIEDLKKTLYVNADNSNICTKK